MEYVGPSVGLSVCLKVYCGKTVEWIRMLFGMESGVGQGMRALDRWGGYRRMEGAILGVEFGASHCN